VQTMNETLARLDERVERIEADAVAIRTILEAEIGARGSAIKSSASNGPSSKRADYTSIDGQEHPPS
jgi:hypothetical protein